MKKDAKEAVELTRYIHQFLDEYAPSHLTGSRHTLKSYRTALSLYMFFLEKVMGITIATLKFSCFSRENIEKWVEWLDGERNCSAATVNIRLVVRQIKRCLKSQIKCRFWERFSVQEVKLIEAKEALCFPLKNHHAKYMVACG